VVTGFGDNLSVFVAAISVGCETVAGRTEIIPIKTIPKAMNPKTTRANIDIAPATVTSKNAAAITAQVYK
jgi:hypothetical protein